MSGHSGRGPGRLLAAVTLNHLQAVTATTGSTRDRIGDLEFPHAAAAPRTAAITAPPS
jgi:hypothetical protein